MVSITFPSGENLEAELADTHFKRIGGLSGKKEKKSMLFVFPFSIKWSFWMPNMAYPLKIIFLNREKEVVDIKAAQPLTINWRTWKTYKPAKSCKFVIETPFDNEIKIGDKLTW